MRAIAEKHLEMYKRDPSHSMNEKQIILTLALGLISSALYGLLYHFNLDIRHLAELANHGSRSGFWAPIVIALLFSMVHGAFTGHFWHILGLRAKC